MQGLFFLQVKDGRKDWQFLTHAPSLLVANAFVSTRRWIDWLFPVYASCSAFKTVLTDLDQRQVDSLE